MAHPTNAGILFVGGTNSGIWRTNNANTLSPTWTALGDSLRSLSIGSMAFDRADATSNTILAGFGRYSSLGRTGGDRAGLVRSTDGGNTWQSLGGAALVGKNISGIVANGNNIVVSANTADNFTFDNIGIFRSTDGGATFTQMSVGNGGATGLPGGASYDLVADPNNSNVMYTSAIFATNVGGQNGIYRTTNGGASWSKISDAAVDSKITNTTSNVELSVGNNGQVFAGVLNSGRLDGLFRLSSGSVNWQVLDIPVTNEPGGPAGSNPGGPKGPTSGPPEEIAGGQGTIHFSILADPNNENLVYIGGDRQPGPGEFGITGWPNSIGAANYSGRLFRVDASRVTGTQSSVLTHRGGTSGNTSTLNNTSPHADSREMAFDANGELVQVDDGGVYRRTSPSVDNAGDWFGAVGNLTATEYHSIGWDPNSNIVFGGTQDVGTTEEVFSGSGVHRTVSQGDGGKVATFDLGTGNSLRYTSFQRIGALRVREVDSNNVVVSTSFASLTGMASGEKQFYTPIAVNRFNGKLFVGGADNVFESSNRGNTVTQLSDSTDENVGVIETGAFNNNDALWVGRGDSLFYNPSAVGRLEQRLTAGGSLITVSAYAGNQVADMAMNELDFQSLVATDVNSIFFTEDAGASFANITGNLFSFGGDDIWSVELFEFNGIDAIFAGLRTGDIYYSLSSLGLGNWFLLGDLPNAPVRDLHYDSSDDILLAGLQGRGAWMFNGISSITAIPEPSGLLALIGGLLLIGTRRRTKSKV